MTKQKIDDVCRFLATRGVMFVATKIHPLLDYSYLSIDPKTVGQFACENDDWWANHLGVSNQDFSAWVDWVNSGKKCWRCKKRSTEKSISFADAVLDSGILEKLSLQTYQNEASPVGFSRYYDAYCEHCLRRDERFSKVFLMLGKVSKKRR